MNDLSTVDFNRIVTLTGVISGEARLRLLMMLRQNESLNVTDLAGRLGASQPATSYHLRELRECGAVECKRRGKEIRYRLVPGMFNPLIECLSAITSG